MMYRWIDVNVDLSLVASIVKEFFESREFRTRIDELDDGCRVLAVKRVNDESKAVFVEVHGRRDDFRVEFSTGSHERSLIMLGPLTTLFGLGAFLQGEIKRSDFFGNLEGDFWIYMEDAIAKFKVSKEN